MAYSNLKQLILSAPQSKAQEIVKRDIITAKVLAPATEVAQLMEKYDLVVIPVIDTQNKLLGRITIDDVVDIIKEEVVDAGIKLLRRRVIVADQRGITLYEGTPTFASDDQVLIKEGQYQVDKLGNVGTSDEGNSFTTNQQIIDEMNDLGFNPNDVTVTPDDID